MMSFFFVALYPCIGKCNTIITTRYITGQKLPLTFKYNKSTSKKNIANTTVSSLISDKSHKSFCKFYEKQSESKSFHLFKF